MHVLNLSWHISLLFAFNEVFSFLSIMAFAYVVQISENQLKASAGKYIYRLASVVQHFGRAGGGHYTVYRRVTSNLENGDEDHQWFGISDSKVYIVSEEEVLAANASLLFYEKNSEAPTEL